MNKMMLMMNLMALSLSYLMMTLISSWIWIWFFLELSLFCTIGLMVMFKEHSILTIFKYYLIQTLASLMILMSMAGGPASSLTINLAILLKFGLFPFSVWVINIYPNLLTTNLILVSVVQKVAPLLLFMNFINPFMLILFVLNMLFAPVFALQSTSWLIIYSASSVFYSSLLFLIMWHNYWLGLILFLTYLTYNTALILVLSLKKQANLKSLMILNMAGLPPTLGFAIKLIISYNLAWSMSPLLITLLLITASPAIFYYLNLFMKTMF